MALDEVIIKYTIWILYFISLYLLLYWMLVMFEHNTPTTKRSILNKEEEVTIILPMWNEEENIGPTLKSLFQSKYPKDKFHVIVVDDGSTDNSYNIAKEYQKQYNFKLITQKNGGKYTALNKGLKYVNTPYFACLDVDGYVDKYAIRNIQKEFTHKNVAAVMPIMKVAEQHNMLQKVQSLEYILNVFLKYFISKIHCVHVTPGPLSTYRTDVVKKLGGFVKGYNTEDLEMALRLQSKHYEIKQSSDAIIYTKAPKTLNGFIAQRLRWYLGSMKNVLITYRYMIFNKQYGEFGIFYIPFVAVNGLLGFLGVAIITYLFIKSMYHFIKRMYLTNFDIVTYITSITFNFDILAPNYQMIFGGLIIYLIIFLYIFLAYINAKEKLSVFETFKKVFVFLYFFLILKFILAYIWFKVFYRLFRGDQNKWIKSK
ncbi:MAG: glycosyltransferase [Candidatus Nanoarchaeia archaeon]